MEQHERLRVIAQHISDGKMLMSETVAAAEAINGAADRLEVLERESAEHYERWHQERRRREALEVEVQNLLDQKGRHNTEVAYRRLVAAMHYANEKKLSAGL